MKLGAYIECEMGDQMTILGYARVSTDGQTLEAQEEALRSSGTSRIFVTIEYFKDMLAIRKL